MIELNRRAEDHSLETPIEIQSIGIFNRIFFSAEGQEIKLRPGTNEQRVTSELAITWDDIMRVLESDGIIKHQEKNTYLKLKAGISRQKPETYPDPKTFFFGAQVNLEVESDLNQKINLISFLRIRLSREQNIYNNKDSNYFQQLTQDAILFTDLIFDHYPLSLNKKKALEEKVKLKLNEMFGSEDLIGRTSTLKRLAEILVDDIYGCLGIK